jgi:hypothetical protein
MTAELHAAQAGANGTPHVLRGCLLRRELIPGMLLPEGSERRIESGYVGVLGAFEITAARAVGIVWRICE